ncbi:transcription elongation factor GreAB [Pseudoalteromonas rubra]|uniref:Transcription elongation factor GreAB n=1 Tax=Pseudoalteromonas rubra TaxID=43658 RepID=A0A5S3WKS0_9GAMM|nr:GreA/GreB family elongation factor [Pseudoalteromonas rubra]TMP27882.1 transcription elongation factor GreAB [Pseudoalteromonas rubra]TMP31157.1 transcription elongation factor GreAB [Pseudoalteromonas rubra]
MNKSHVIEHLKFALECKLQEAQQAADSARADAIHEQSAAETQYDSLSIESGYLAEGQSERVDQAHQAIHAFAGTYTVSCPSAIQVGTLVELADEQSEHHWFYIGPCEGGLKLTVGITPVRVITLASPIGRALQGRGAGEEIEFHFNGTTQWLEVISLS